MAVQVERRPVANGAQTCRIVDWVMDGDGRVTRIFRLERASIVALVPISDEHQRHPQPVEGFKDHRDVVFRLNPAQTKRIDLGQVRHSGGIGLRLDSVITAVRYYFRVAVIALLEIVGDSLVVSDKHVRELYGHSFGEAEVMLGNAPPFFAPPFDPIDISDDPRAT